MDGVATANPASSNSSMFSVSGSTRERIAKIAEERKRVTKTKSDRKSDRKTTVFAAIDSVHSEDDEDVFAASIRSTESFQSRPRDAKASFTPARRRSEMSMSEHSGSKYRERSRYPDSEGSSRKSDTSSTRSGSDDGYVPKKLESRRRGSSASRERTGTSVGPQFGARKSGLTGSIHSRDDVMMRFFNFPTKESTPPITTNPFEKRNRGRPEVPTRTASSNMEGTSRRREPSMRREPSVDRAAPSMRREPSVDRAAPSMRREPSVDRAAPSMRREPSVDRAAPSMRREPSVDQAAPSMRREPSVDRAPSVAQELSPQEPKARRDRKERSVSRGSKRRAPSVGAVKKERSSRKQRVSSLGPLKKERSKRSSSVSTLKRPQSPPKRPPSPPKRPQSPSKRLPSPPKSMGSPLRSSRHSRSEAKRSSRTLDEKLSGVSSSTPASKKKVGSSVASASGSVSSSRKDTVRKTRKPTRESVERRRSTSTNRDMASKSGSVERRRPPSTSRDVAPKSGSVERRRSTSTSRDMASKSGSGERRRSTSREGASKPISGDGSPRRGSVSPRRGSVSPRRGSVSPRRGSVSPRRGSVSPSRRVPDSASRQVPDSPPRRYPNSPRRAPESPEQKQDDPVDNDMSIGNICEFLLSEEDTTKKKPPGRLSQRLANGLRSFSKLAGFGGSGLFTSMDDDGEEPAEKRPESRRARGSIRMKAPAPRSNSAGPLGNRPGMKRTDRRAGLTKAKTDDYVDDEPEEAPRAYSMMLHREATRRGKSTSLMDLQQYKDEEIHSTSYFASNHVLVNRERMKRGLRPLTRNIAMDELARGVAQTMSENEGKTSLPATYVGNVLRGESIRAIHRAVMVNKEGRERLNILNPYFQDFGVGTSKGKDGMLYICQLFSERIELTITDTTA